MQNGNKLAHVMVTYLLEEMCNYIPSELCYNEDQRNTYYLETMENRKHLKSLTLGDEVPKVCGPRWGKLVH